MVGAGVKSWKYQKAMGVCRRRAKWAFAILDVGLRAKNFQKTWSQQLSSDYFTHSLLKICSVSRVSLNSCNDRFLSEWDWHCTRARFTLLVSCSDQRPPSPCKGRIRNRGADCSTIGFYFLAITWQQIFKGSLEVTGSVVILIDLLLNLEGFSHC